VAQFDPRRGAAPKQLGIVHLPEDPIVSEYSSSVAEVSSLALDRSIVTVTAAHTCLYCTCWCSKRMAAE
jgi:hypothetical protein